ncbi:2-amino-4-hydroxy-6-hydroxymethyldihydropteridine diphosphokinase [Lentilitoribacter sp. EG35]|uniref:2-amino-4-hydroxy-6- hydroxymethyldihydropteridine diphosphokinase n=1 Tax=Lentilitoribacter sp. EG35 TaxID=3234192 RepID=UPI00345FF343
MMTKTIQAALGLGGNLGDPKAQIQEALLLLSANENIDIEAVSHLYKTAPWGNTDQPSFLNACVLISTNLSARRLLEVCLAIEGELGRVRLERWGPRAIDLDVLFYADVQVDEPGLELPHPRMTERAFVMVPLSDVVPDKIIEENIVQFWADRLSKDDIEVADDTPLWWQKGKA